MIFHTFVFLISCFVLFVAGEWLVQSLSRIARFLCWREFVVAFIVMAFAASLPNLFVGITSVLHQVPELCFGDVAGNNLVALTLAISLAVLIGKKELPAESKTVQVTSVFTMIAAILPLILILDGKLTRGDGILLISTFFLYIFWLFSKRERFTRVYDGHEAPSVKGFKVFIQDLGKIIFGLMLLLLAAQSIVSSAQFFAHSFNVSIILIGVLVTGLGSALPEVYFAIISAKRGETWMILGNLMGAVIVPATLVLGIIALISPIEIIDFSPLLVARLFLTISALFFFFFTKTDRKITKREALFLLLIYILFVVFTVLLQ